MPFRVTPYYLNIYKYHAIDTFSTISDIANCYQPGCQGPDPGASPQPLWHLNIILCIYLYIINKVIDIMLSNLIYRNKVYVYQNYE